MYLSPFVRSSFHAFVHSFPVLSFFHPSSSRLDVLSNSVRRHYALTSNFTFCPYVLFVTASFRPSFFRPHFVSKFSAFLNAIFMNFRSFAHSFFYLVVHSLFVLSSFPPFVLSSLRLHTFIHSYVVSSLRPFIPTFLYAYVLSFFCAFVHSLFLPYVLMCLRSFGIL